MLILAIVIELFVLVVRDAPILLYRPVDDVVLPHDILSGSALLEVFGLPLPREHELVDVDIREGLGDADEVPLAF